MRLQLLTLLILAAPSCALAAGLAVDIDQAARITLARPAREVIVGNPAIADVTMLDGRHLIVTGKSYGVTNLVVADQSGRTIFSREIVIGSSGPNHVSLHRGMDVADFACSPRCERTVATAGAPAGTQTTAP
ncbi:MAG TPA: pilus assembly protein N-terminal domain-containing protein [Caulobacteraceae bacterium]